jgi:flagellar hook-associated protein 3 FlgL
MRVNPNPIPDVLAALNRTRQDEQEALLQMSSGRRVNQPSDDPAAAAVLIQNRDQATFTARYLASLDSLQGQFQTADSALSSVVLALQRALTLGVEGANGTLSDQNRAAIVGELQGIQDQLLSLANTSFQGRYLFSGTVTATPPFAKDNTVPSGVRYDGNDTINAVQIGDGYRMAANQPGSQLFVAPGHDMFQAMTGLIQAMQSNSGFDAALASVRDSFDHLSGQRVFYGNAMNQGQSQSNYLGTAKLQLSQQQNTLAGADIEAAASNLVRAQNSTNATLAALGRISQLNLFDYLK